MTRTLKKTEMYEVLEAKGFKKYREKLQPLPWQGIVEYYRHDKIPGMKILLGGGCEADVYFGDQLVLSTYDHEKLAGRLDIYSQAQPVKSPVGNGAGFIEGYQCDYHMIPVPAALYRLVQLFGSPNASLSGLDCYKVTFEYQFHFKGYIAAVYDYKTGLSIGYRGAEPPEEIRKEAVQFFSGILGNPVKATYDGYEV